MSSRVEIQMPDGFADAYLARRDDEPHPGVLLLMDAYGLRPVIEEMADRIAADGYLVLAPNVFYRAGRSPVKPGMDFQKIRPLMAELTPERLAADGAAYLDYLAAVASPGPVAITGYCMGGRLGWWIAAAQPDRVAALAAFHTGGLVTDDPDSPHRAAGRVDAELYFGFADKDQGMTVEHIATLEETLETPAPATAPRSTTARVTGTRWPTCRSTTKRPASVISASSGRCSSERSASAARRGHAASSCARFPV